ncbi:MAG TPA: extracellular solute-binding protein [Acidobacteriaceae bacterium]|nr:extracellular solute-binding protein [Acidobacteriaceae bacterium]
MSRQERFRVAIRKFAPFESAIQKQWAAFETLEKTGLQLETEALDLHPLSESLFGNEGLLRGAWDVSFISTDWLALIDQTRSVVDLAPFLQADPPEGYPSGWTPSLLRMQQFGSSVLGVPYHDGPECLIYRRDLLEDPQEQAAYLRRFGAPLQAPRTWDEFHRIARFFHRPEQGLYGTAFAAYPDGHNTVYDFLLQLWTRGGELFDPAGRIRFATPQAIEALTFYRSMLQDSAAVHPRCREMDSVQSGLAFAAGEIAMMVNWFGFGAMSETIAESRVKGRVGIAEIPHGEGASSVSLSVYWILSIAAGSPHIEIAYRFLRHCLSERMDKLLTLEGGIGCRRSTWNDAEVNRSVPLYGELEKLHAGAREMPRMVKWPQVAEIIDRMVLEAIHTSEPIEQIAGRAESSTGLCLEKS